ncbi:hypothetical protein Val02_52300 [Virgisporangium aliadipatigenens]|uniref:Orc1-like AAA ATPase domain-containing protein n=1 Tax=Virgisporangium aliadipatigenens TaxID=741659 RepID=A0A8J3YMN5_9ACTN|nr:ATP-binding protein [Virgisporangium aliadipatigenens]GIJ48344.1 hypothetical protein Val02_52300 [Virgisporangium aliadipatigenens]
MQTPTRARTGRAIAWASSTFGRSDLMLFGTVAVLTAIYRQHFLPGLVTVILYFLWILVRDSVWPGRRGIAHLVDWYSASAGVRPRDYLVPRELPPVLPKLVGREQEVDLISAHLRRAGAGGPRLVLIEGEPGIGKTSLAIQTGHAVAEHFPDGQLFVQVKVPRSEFTREGAAKARHAVVGRIVSALRGPGENVADAPDDRLRQYRHMVRLRPRVLIIFDAVNHPDVLPSIVPQGGSWGAIVTTQLRGLSDRLPKAYRVRLEGLDSAASVRLLRGAVGDQRVASEDAQIRQIVGAAAGKPIPLQAIATSLAARPHLRLSDLIEQAKESGPSGTPSPGSLDLSYALLTDEEQRAFRRLALLDERHFTGWMLAALLDAEDESHAIRIAHRLLNADLIERSWNDAGGAPRFALSSTVHDHVRARFGTALSDKERRRLLDRLERAKAGRQKQRTVPGLREKVYAPLIEGRLTTALHGARQAVALAKEQGESLGESRALAAFAYVCGELGSFDLARETALAAIAKGARRGRGTVRALRTLGRMERRTRRFTPAEKLLRDALDRATERDTAETVRLRLELCVVQALAGSPREALATSDEAARLCGDGTEMDRRHRPGLLWARSIALEADNRLEAARAAATDAWYGADALGQRLWMAWLWHRRAEIELAAGNRETALGFGFRAIGLFGEMEHRYGKAHGRLLLGRCHLCAGRSDEASRVLEEAAVDFVNCSDRWARNEALRLLAAARAATDPSSCPPREQSDAVSGLPTDRP